MDETLRACNCAEPYTIDGEDPVICSSCGQLRDDCEFDPFADPRFYKNVEAQKVKRIPINGFLAEDFVVHDTGKKARKVAEDNSEPKPRSVKVGQEILHKGEVLKVVDDHGDHMLVRGDRGEFLITREQAILGAPPEVAEMTWHPPKVIDSGVVRLLKPDQVKSLRPEVVNDIRKAIREYDVVILYSADFLNQDYTERVKWLLRKERVSLMKLRFEHMEWV